MEQQKFYKKLSGKKDKKVGKYEIIISEVETLTTMLMNNEWGNDKE